MTLAQIWSQRRRIILFALLIVLLVVVLARQADLIPPGPAGRVARLAIQPLTTAVAAVDRFVTGAWVTLFRSRDLAAENDQLNNELADLRVHNQQLTDALAQLQRLSKLTTAQPVFGQPTVAANIVSFSPNFWTRTVMIDCGRRDGVTTGMTVVNQDGLVGFIRDVSPKSALVQLLVDPEFAAGALTSQTRERGIVQGTGQMDRLLMTLDHPQPQVQSGFDVVTSGQPAESLFRKGLVIGKIVGVEQNKYGQPCAAVKPTVRFDRLEEVVVLLEPAQSASPPQQLPVPPP